MKKLIIFLVLTMSTLLVAQPNYKYILAHMSEFADGEAMFRLKEYQTWYPKKAHPYYLMANIHYRTYAKENPLLNYNELSAALYEMIIYYGNCAHFIHNESVKKEWYLETAVDGKVSEESVRAFVLKRMNEAKELRSKVDELYISYSQLVSNYDSCLMDMNLLAQHYLGEKEAQLMIDENDMNVLSTMMQRARKIPANIQRFEKALNEYPIDDYEPKFIFRPINHFRMEGMTTSNFLQNEVLLWDFVAWGNNFLEDRKRNMLTYRKYLENEYLRQNNAWTSAKDAKQNTFIINMIDHRDEGSAMTNFMQLQYFAVQAHALEQQIIRTDSVDVDAWIALLQQTHRIYKLLEQANTTAIGLPEQLEQPLLKRKYADFIQRFFPNEPLWGQRAVELWKNNIQLCYKHACEKILSVSEGYEPVIRISDDTEAIINSDSILFRHCNYN